MFTWGLTPSEHFDVKVLRCRAGSSNLGAMERVAIVGPGGAGKSTFARELGARTGAPVIHLDRHFWKPGWVETEPDVWRQVQSEILVGDRWIVDGNYGGTFDERFARTDTVIVVARHRIACVMSAIWRSAKNHGQEIQADGCPERFKLSFYRWVWNYPRDSRPRLDAAIERHPHLAVVELRTRDEMGQFLGAIAAGASAD